MFPISPILANPTLPFFREWNASVLVLLTMGVEVLVFAALQRRELRGRCVAPLLFANLVLVWRLPSAIP